MSLQMVIPETQDEMRTFQQWFYKKTMEIDRETRKLEDEKRRLQLQQEKLERERRDFGRQKEAQAKLRAQEEYVLQMKQRVLLEELKKLADEKQHIERKREFYDRVRQFQQKQESTLSENGSIVKGELFFIGVQSEMALKKRYKDLVRIYHPDNVCGDTETLQEINREYDKLRLAFTAG